MPTPPLSQADLLELWRRIMDPSYTVPIEDEQNGQGFDVPAAQAAIFAAADDCANTIFQAHYLKPHPIQTAPPASGPAKATADIEITRVTSTAGDLPLSAGTLLQVEQLGSLGQTIQLMDYELAEAVTMPDGTRGPVAAVARATRPGYSGNVAAGAIVGFKALGRAEIKPVELLSTTVLRLPQPLPLGSPITDRFTRGMVGRFATVLGLPSGVQTPRKITTVDFGTQEAMVSPPFAAGDVGATGLTVQVVELGDLGLVVTQDAPATGGKLALLDAIGRDRKTGRVPGETDDQYRQRLCELADTVSPGAIERAADRILTPCGVDYEIYETRDVARLKGFVLDIDPLDFGQVTPIPNNGTGDLYGEGAVLLNASEAWTFFLIRVELGNDGEFGFAYDATAVGMDPENAYDVEAFYDGAPLGYLACIGALWQELNGTRAGGVNFDIDRGLIPLALATIPENTVISGIAFGESSAFGSAFADAAVAGVALGDSSAIGSLDNSAAAIEGLAEGESSASGTVHADAVVVGAAPGESSATGTAFAHAAVAGVAAGDSSATGTVHAAAAVAGVAAGDSSATGTVSSSGGGQNLGLNRGVLDYATDGMAMQLGVNPGDVSTYAADIDATGSKWVRARIVWDDVEQSAGVYNWTVAPNYDRIVDEFNALGIGVMFMLRLGSNTGVHGAGAAPPYDAGGRVAFGEFAAAAVAHWPAASNKVMFELGNEPNIPAFWPISPVNETGALQAADEYSDLADVVIPLMRAEDDDVYIIGPGLANKGINQSVAEAYLQRLVDNGVIAQLDAASVHFYTAEGDDPEDPMGAGKAPEEATYDDYLAIASPIIGSEHGWKSDDTPTQDRLQASYNIRDFIYGLHRGIRMRILFLWGNSPGSDYFINGRPTENALAILEQELGGYRLNGRVATGNSDQYVFEFEDDTGDKTLAVWKRDNGVSSSYSHPASDDATEVDYLGSTSTLTESGGNISITLETDPKYIRLPTSAIAGVAAGDSSATGTVHAAAAVAGVAAGDSSATGTLIGGAAFQSDDFNSASLGAHWTFENPAADCSVGITGFGGGDVTADISVPSGSTHHFDGSNKDAARITQPVADEDVVITAKWNDDPSSPIQMRGLMFMESDTKAVVIGIYWTGAGGGELRAFVNGVDGASETTLASTGSLGSGNAARVRVTRVGDDWDVEVAAAGDPGAGGFTSILSGGTYAINMTKIGMWAGNAGGVPSYTAEADWVENSDDPLSGDDT